jgi:hypothetical protein
MNKFRVEKGVMRITLLQLHVSIYRLRNRSLSPTSR